METATYTMENFTAKTYYSESITAIGRDYDINCSDILTKLIKECGRLCERYASDLFITWDSIQQKFKNRTIETSSYLFGIRESGVDHNEFILARYNNYGEKARYEYRKIYRLDIEINDDGKIIMELYEVMKP